VAAWRVAAPPLPPMMVTRLMIVFPSAGGRAGFASAGKDALLPLPRPPPVDQLPEKPPWGLSLPPLIAIAPLFDCSLSG